MIDIDKARRAMDKFHNWLMHEATEEEQREFRRKIEAPVKNCVNEDTEDYDTPKEKP